MEKAATTAAAAAGSQDGEAADAMTQVAISSLTPQVSGGGGRRGGWGTRVESRGTLLSFSLTHRASFHTHGAHGRERLGMEQEDILQLHTPLCPAP